jgi:hypothetical protein
MLRALLVTFAAASVLAAVAAPAEASQLIDRNATHISLKVNRKGQALIQYRVGRQQRHVLAWGAINARPAVASENAPRPQVKFKVDYSGGWGTYGKVVWPTFKNTCGKYDGPKLAYFVTGCKAADGSYWALQSWQVELPDLGFTPWIPKQRSWRLELSHWTGPLATLEAYTNWVWSGRYHGLFGRLLYRGQPVHGYHTTKFGEVLDGYGRNIELDTYDSAYGPGWRRENAFVAHNPNGNFCYGFYPHDPTKGGYYHPPGYSGGMRPMGNGSEYRLSVVGPGVTPDVTWQGKGLPQWNAEDPALVSLEDQMNALAVQFAAGDPSCRVH